MRQPPHMMHPQFVNQPPPVHQSMYNPNTSMPNHPPSPGGNNRPLSTLVSQREQDQYVNTQAPPDRRYLGPGNPSASKFVPYYLLNTFIENKI